MITINGKRDALVVLLKGDLKSRFKMGNYRKIVGKSLDKIYFNN